MYAISWAGSLTSCAKLRVSHGPAAMVVGCWSENWINKYLVNLNIFNNLKKCFSFENGCTVFTFLQSWKTAKPTEMTNEKNDNWRALNALIPKIPRPNGTRVMTFNRMKVKIGIATFFSFDLRDSTGAVLNLTLKSTSSFCKLRAEMVSLLSATGKSNETSLRWT